MQLAEDSGSKAACYHLARRLGMDTEDHVRMWECVCGGEEEVDQLY